MVTSHVGGNVPDVDIARLALHEKPHVLQSDLALVLIALVEVVLLQVEMSVVDIQQFGGMVSLLAFRAAQSHVGVFRLEVGRV